MLDLLRRRGSVAGALRPFAWALCLVGAQWLAAAACRAQALPVWSWAQQVPCLSGATDGRVATDAAGNVYLCSSFYPTGRLGTTTLTTQGSHDLYLAKFTARGDVLWVRAYGNADADRAASLATDPSGNVYLTGSFTSATLRFGAHTLTNHGRSDLFLVKFDAQGQVLWARNPGSAAEEWGASVAVDGHGNPYLAGGFGGTLPLGSGALVTRGDNDIFVARFDAQGNALWGRQVGGPRYESGGELAVAPTGEVSLAATLRGPVAYVDQQPVRVPGLSDLVVVRYSPWGTVQWVRQTQAGVQAYGAGVAVDARGHTYVTGFFQGPTRFGSTTVASQGLVDFFVARYDARGEVQWVRSAHGPNEEQGTAVAVDAGGTAYVTGRFVSPQLVLGTLTLPNANPHFSSDSFVAAFDSLGAVRWALRTGGPTDDNALSLALDGRGHAYLTGHFVRETTIGATTLIGDNVTLGPFFSGWLARLETGVVPPPAPPLPPPPLPPPPAPAPPAPPVVPPAARFMPNIITPNGDGQNDVLHFRGVEAAELAVFTRWGQRVYYAARYANDWAAAQQPAGLYYYVLRTSPGESFRGWVEVVR